MPQHPASRLTTWYRGSSKNRVEERDLKTACMLSLLVRGHHSLHVTLPLSAPSLQLCCKLALLLLLVLFLSLCPSKCETRGRLPQSLQMPRGGMAGSYGGFIPIFLRNHHTVFHSGCIDLHSHQQCKNVAFLPPQLMRICSLAQETQTGALYQPRGVGWGGRWEGGSRGRGHVYTYG